MAGPILETDFGNPSYPPSDMSDPSSFRLTWAKDVAGGQTALEHETPVWEWTPILDPHDEFDTKLVGLSGLAIATHLSETDVPFQHPFGFDWNLDVKVDPQYESLVAPDNQNSLTQDVQDALDALGLPHTGMMHVETDQGLIPDVYRAQSGDRVAVFGRWIVDCGHDPFTSEIHPPLLLARAQSTPDNGTHSTVVGRAFLVSQEFGDGALRKHLINEIVRVAPNIPGIPIPFGSQVEAHPQIHQTPFSGIHLIQYRVRPPIPRPSADVTLIVSFHFTVRTGVVVQLLDDSANDAVGVLISMNDGAYTPAPVPQKSDWNITLDDLDVLQHGLGTTIKEVLVGVAVGGGLILPDPASLAVLAGVLGRGVLTDKYDPLVASSVHDSEVTTVAVNRLGGGPHFSVDDGQPFPIYGFLDVRWSQSISTNVASGAASAGNTSVVVATSTDGRIFYDWWKLGEGGHGWRELEGDWRTDAAPAAALVGDDHAYLFVIVKGLDGQLYLNQGQLGSPFVGWQQMG
jgi:hypothetical protein